jgi:dolichol-phosphate mannosyltransferase
MISIISPIYNEAENLRELCRRIIKALEATQEDFEIILVENGSYDDSLKIIKSLRNDDPRIKFLSLSRNFGHQGAILAGLAYASGDAVISLDGDLQQPPELLPKMIQLWQEGNDVVYTIKKNQINHLNFRLSMTKLFYTFISRISDLKLSYGQSDFRLIDRKIVDILSQLDEKNKFLRGLVDWVGFRQIGVEYEPAPRQSGESKFSFWNYMSFALDGIFSFSTMPLKISLWSGLIIAFIFGFLAVYYLIKGIINFSFNGDMVLPPGWLTIVVGIFFLGGIQLISVGILGEYIGRIFSQTKARPEFIVKEKELE